MKGRAFAAGLAMWLLLLAHPATAQIQYQPTPPPSVTAEHEDWYLQGLPVMHAGAIYYPAGPQVHFMPLEMVPSGSHQGIPLYVRTTLEPNSIVFVPVARGLMQPYERRRDGDLAGTVGSRAPAFPVGSAAEAPAPVAQAPAPPALPPAPEPPVAVPAMGRGVPEPTGTSGVRSAAAPAVVPSVPARRPGRTDGIFVEIGGTRWYSDGVRPRLDPRELSQQGEYRGRPVYVRPGDPAIYLPLSRQADAPLTRYVRR